MEDKTPEPMQRVQLSPWKQGFETISQLRSQMVYLSLVGMAIPLSLFEVYQGQISHNFSSIFREIRGYSESVEFFTYFSSLSEFIGQYGISWVVLLSFLTLPYFHMVLLATDKLEGRERSVASQLGTSLRSAVPSGIMSGITIMGLMFIFSVLSVSFLGPLAQFALLLAISLCCAVPYLLVTQRTGPIRSVFSALKMSYAPPIRGIRWSIFFQLSSTQIFLIAVILSLATLKQYALDLDLLMGWKRDSWAIPSPIPPFSWVYLMSHFIYSLAVGFSLMSFAVITSTFFNKIRSLGDKISHDQSL